LSVWRVRDHYYDRKKKDTVVCLAGARSLVRPEKKKYSRLSGGCAIVITTGKTKSSSPLSGGCAIVITTGKKRNSRLSGGCAIIIMTGKKKDTVIYLAGARSLLQPEKIKYTVVCLADA
jgi:hypothetical protein